MRTDCSNTIGFLLLRRGRSSHSKGFIAMFPLTAVAKLLWMPSFHPGISNVEVWHQGFSFNSVSMTFAKHSDHPLRGYAAHAVLTSAGWIRFARLLKPVRLSRRRRNESNSHASIVWREIMEFIVWLWILLDGLHSPRIVANCRTCPIVVIFPLACTFSTTWRRYYGTYPLTKMSWWRIMASQMLSAWSSTLPSLRRRSRATIAPLNSKDILVVAKNRFAVPISCNKQAK